MCGMDVIASLKLTAKAPENWWLGDDPFLLGPGPFVTLSPIVMVSWKMGGAWKMIHGTGKFAVYMKPMEINDLNVG